MAVAVQMLLRNATLDDYDRVNELMGLLPGGPASRQELFHWVAEMNDGIRVVDVWESQEAFETFREERLAQCLHEVGDLELTEVQFFEIHNYLMGSHRR